MNFVIRNEVDELYCSFIGRIVKIQNKYCPWFEKCYICNERVHPIEFNSTANCQKCNNENSNFVRKYMLKMVVSDGDEEADITLFYSVDYLIGCGATEYFNQLKVHII